MSESSPPDKKNSSSDRLAILLSWKIVILLVVVILALIAMIAVERARAMQEEYRQAIDQVSAIHEVAHRDDIYALSREDMTWLNDEFHRLENRIDEIERLGELPLGLEDPLSGLPWIKPRFQAGMETLELGRLLAQSGQTISKIGEEAIAALDDTGVRHDPENDADTWLDVISASESDLLEALDQIELAMQKRSAIDEAYLPQRIIARLLQIDEVMDQFSEQLELADELPLAYEALGADQPKRYLILLQNPAELRPTGGFVGTIARLELHRGQIRQFEFHDVYALSSEYADQDEHRLRAPWPVREYIRPDHLQFQDANWWADFPESAGVLMDMASAAGWPELDGVVAVQPETIQDLISVTGPIAVEVDGAEREITSDNLHDEAERQRRIRREGGEAEAGHKEVLELISEILVDELSESDRTDVIDAVFLLFERLDRRDMQVYHNDPDVQEFLTARNWAGLIDPEPDIPTISSTFANITGLKTSLAMQPHQDLQFLENDTPGVIEGILTLSLDHVGAEEGDPFYEGFQRWWVDVKLPPGAAVVGTEPEPSSDPDASSGGAYIVNLHVGEREDIVIRFSMPETDQLLIRRQPGVVTVQGSASSYGCDYDTEYSVNADILLEIADKCFVATSLGPEE